MREGYHDEVAAYYDEESDSFEQRAGQNHVLEDLRGFFRTITLAHAPRRMLEIGYGPGLDMTWFADRPEIEIVHGVDLTPGFHRIVKRKAEARGDGRMVPHLASAESAPDVLGKEAVDTVIVFFGALNTTENLDAAADAVHDVLQPGGTAVLTFVNKWYLFDILWHLATLRPRKAVARLRTVWGGYSPTRHLPSRCFSSRAVHRSFGRKMRRVQRHGFCIVHPAWYRHHWAPAGSLRGRFGHRIDRWLRWTPFWNLGEYSLYVYERPATTS